MVTRYRCPECGQPFLEDIVCPGCLCDVLPDALHKEGTATFLCQPDLTSEERMYESLMRRNRGLNER